MDSDDLEDSLDSLFSSVGSPKTKIKSVSVADEDKRREARLIHQKDADNEDVDTLLSELRSARNGGSMARSGANVFDPTPSPKAKGGRRRSREDTSNSLSKEAADLLHGSSNTLKSTRSARLGGAAVSWLDSSPKTSPTNLTTKPKPNPKQHELGKNLYFVFLFILVVVQRNNHFFYLLP